MTCRVDLLQAFYKEIHYNSFKIYPSVLLVYETEREKFGLET
jgi:hypothetical protein